MGGRGLQKFPLEHSIVIFIETHNAFGFSTRRYRVEKMLNVIGLLSKQRENRHISRL